MNKESLEHEVVSKGVFRAGLFVEKTPRQVRIDNSRDFSRI